jgi:hypothetical protein
MNERIIELAEQAGFENGHQDRYGNSLSQELEKFAELIVRECTEVTADWYKNHNQYHMPPDEHIKAHFGVE